MTAGMSIVVARRRRRAASPEPFKPVKPIRKGARAASTVGQVWRVQGAGFGRLWFFFRLACLGGSFPRSGVGTWAGRSCVLELWASGATAFGFCFGAALGCEGGRRLPWDAGASKRRSRAGAWERSRLQTNADGSGVFPRWAGVASAGGGFWEAVVCFQACLPRRIVPPLLRP